MRVVVAGDWHSSIHEQPAYEALIRLGHEARRFSWHGYFRSTGPAQIRSLESAWKKIQNKYLFGPLMARLNRDFVASVVEWRPELLFVYRGTHITKATLENIRKGSPETFLIGYNNDDPFSPTQPHWAWRHFLAAVPAYDLMLAYRHRNIADFRKVGAKEVRLLRSWFVPEINHPVELQPNDKASYESDVVFIGHYEADNRLAYLDAIAAMGIKLRVFGPEYPNNLGFKHLKVLSPIRSVRGEEYNKALCGAKIALCFLSSLNRDTYTRRCFEIPATRTLMLSEYSDDLASLFQPGVEADYFCSLDELRQKVRLYVEDEARRRSVAEAGFRRVWADGHDVTSRMRQVIEWVGEMRER